MTLALLSTTRNLTAFLTHDFSPDIAAFVASGNLVPGTLSHIRLQNAESLAERADRFGLSEAAADVRRRRAAVIDTIKHAQARESGRSHEESELRGTERFQRAAVLREGDERERVKVEYQR